MRSYINCCQLVALPLDLLPPHATPLFFSTSDSEEIGARSSQNDGGLDPSVSAAIQSAVSESMGSLADNLAQVIESRLTSRSDFPRKTARPLNKQSRELGANTIPAKGREFSSSWIIPFRCWIS